jgi:hypothetical protein
MDGFDKYGATYFSFDDIIIDASDPTCRTLITEGDWTFLNTINTYTTVFPPLSETGYSLGLVGGPLTKTLPNDYSRLIGGVRIQSFGLMSNGGIVFLDDSSYQCSITLDAVTGLVSFRNGNITGNSIETSVVNVSAGVTYFLEWDITFGNSALYEIWLDGVSILSGNGNTVTTVIIHLMCLVLVMV